MIFLKNDYSMGAHPAVLEALVETNMNLSDGYGTDEYCSEAAAKIRTLIGCPTADVHFLTGGTQTNQTALAAFLMRPHWSVISADTGHICVHETGAIEATGHKINHVLTPEGKLKPEDIEEVVLFHEDEHFVRPKAVYISNSTETGLVYTKAELEALRAVCDKYALTLYMDGARLAMALSSEKCDLEFTDLPKLLDAFYIGGTKCGAMFGEALVIVNDNLKSEMRALIKQRGGLLAKGRLLGVQFSALMDEGVYLEGGAHANKMAKILSDGIKAKGYEFAIPPETNLVFPYFPAELIAAFDGKVKFEPYHLKKDGLKSIRLVTSWATTEEEVKAFLNLI